MQNALISVVIAVVMVAGGRILVRYERRALAEGLFSSVVGISMPLTWYSYFPDDFQDLGYFVTHRLRHLVSTGMMTSDSAFPAVMSAVVPASIAFVLFLLVHRGQREPGEVKSVFGPLGRIRRPRRLR